LDKGRAKLYAEEDLFHPPGFGPPPNYSQVGPMQLAHQEPNLIGISQQLGFFTQVLSGPFAQNVVPRISSTLTAHDPVISVSSGVTAPTDIVTPTAARKVYIYNFQENKECHPIGTCG
jgi:hypothetical protein